MNPNLTEWEDQDFLMAAELRKIMAAPLWKWLKAYWSLQREAILLKMKKARAEDGAWRYIGELEGFDKALVIPEKILAEAERQAHKRGDIEVPEGVLDAQG